jgi:HK97 family phage major capsid protein
MLKALLEKRAKLIADMQAIIESAETEDRDLTAEEAESYDTLKASKEKLDARIARAQDVEASSQELETVARPAAGRGNGIVHAPGPPARRQFESLAEFFAAVRFNQDDPRLQYVEGTNGSNIDENGELRAEQRMDNQTTGGYMVPTEIRSSIFSIDPQSSIVRSRAQVIGAGSQPDAAVAVPVLDQTGATQPQSVFGGITVAWLSEGQSKPDTSAALRQVILTPHEVAASLVITDKLLRNWQGSREFIKNLFVSAVLAAEDFAFIRGSGVGQPLGIINSGAAYVESRAGGANTVTYDDIFSMAARMLMRGGTPVWTMSQSVMPQLAQLRDGNNNYIWQPDARLGFAGTLLGWPVVWNNRQPALGTKGDVMLSDFSYYLIKDGSGPFVAASEHVLFQSNKTMIKVFWNVDGAPWLSAPFNEENAYQVSPFVVLAA